MEKTVAAAFAAMKKEHSVKNNEECLDYFDEWSTKYDQDVGAMGYSPQRRATLMFMEHAKDMEVREVLDVGGGTGYMAELFRNQAQYKGEIDILDGSMEMLYVASKRPVQARNIIRHCVNGQMPVRDASYDVVVCVGCFLPKHIPAAALPGVLNAVRPGGLLIFNLRAQTTEEYNRGFDVVVAQLLKEGKMSHVATDEYPLFEKNDRKVNSLVFVYRRL